MLDTQCSEVVWRVLATHSSRQFPLHFPFHASPCAITFQLECRTFEVPFSGRLWYRFSHAKCARQFQVRLRTLGWNRRNFFPYPPQTSRSNGTYWSQKARLLSPTILIPLVYYLALFFSFPPIVEKKKSICDAVVSRSSLIFSNYCWPSWKQFQMSFPVMLPAVTGKLYSLLYLRIGLLRRDRQPFRISGLWFYRLIPEPVDQTMLHLNTVMRRLTTGMLSEKCVARRFRRCANVIKCAYTNLDNIAYYRYASLNDGDMFWEMRR